MAPRSCTPNSSAGCRTVLRGARPSCSPNDCLAILVVVAREGGAKLMAASILPSRGVATTGLLLGGAAIGIVRPTAAVFHATIVVVFLPPAAAALAA